MPRALDHMHGALPADDTDTPPEAVCNLDHSAGTCADAGTAWCDWECPFNAASRTELRRSVLRLQPRYRGLA